MLITRSDRSFIALWWWNIDRLLLTSFLILILFGIFLVMSSSQHVAESLNISSHHFTLRHILLGIFSIPIIIFFTIVNDRQIIFICLSFKIVKKIIMGMLKIPNKICLSVK